MLEHLHRIRTLGAVAMLFATVAAQGGTGPGQTHPCGNVADADRCALPAMEPFDSRPDTLTEAEEAVEVAQRAYDAAKATQDARKKEVNQVLGRLNRARTDLDSKRAEYDREAGAQSKDNARKTGKDLKDLARQVEERRKKVDALQSQYSEAMAQKKEADDAFAAASSVLRDAKRNLEALKAGGSAPPKP